MSFSGATLFAIARTAVVAVVLLYAVLVAGLWFFQRTLMYPAWSLSDDAGIEPPPPGVSVVEVATSDGERLRAMWKPPAPGSPVVLGFHGNAATPAPYARRFSNDPPWTDLGVGVLFVAYRGYPGSTGSPSEAGLLEDARAALSFVRERAPEAPLVIYGHSLGSAVAVALSTEAEARLLYLEAPFSTATRVASHRYPFVPTFLLKDTFRSDLRLPKTKAAAVLIVHGEADSVIPVTEGDTLAATLPGTVLLHIPGEDHVSVLGEGDATAARMITAGTDAE